jgi:hypothetical protein
VTTVAFLDTDLLGKVAYFVDETIKRFTESLPGEALVLLGNSVLLLCLSLQHSQLVWRDINSSRSSSGTQHSQLFHLLFHHFLLLFLPRIFLSVPVASSIATAASAAR